MGARAGVWVGLAGFAALAVACRAPTQVRLEIATDADCSDVTGTAITSGLLVQLEGLPPTTETTRCDPKTGRIGALVVVPAGKKDEKFAVRVVTGFYKEPEQCVRDGYTGGCIVARRALSFIPHETIELPIVMEAACVDVPCGATETCRSGECVPATLDDPLGCTDPAGCDDEVGSGTGGQGGAGGEAPELGGEAPTTGGAPSPTGGAQPTGGGGDTGGLEPRGGTSGGPPVAGASGTANTNGRAGSSGSASADGGEPGTGGAPPSAGTAGLDAQAGGVATGGVATGGVATGGVAAGGVAAGGVAAGGEGGVAGTTAVGGTPGAIDQSCGTGLPLAQLDTDGDGTLDVLDDDDDGDGLTDAEECSAGPATHLLDGSFEIPYVPDGSTRRGDQHFPGWTSNQLIPLWAGGYSGVIPSDGRQLVAMTGHGQLFVRQSFATTPGTTIRWSFLHRAHSGIDTIRVAVASEFQGDYTTDQDEWVLHTGTWDVPDGVIGADLMLLTDDDTGSIGLIDEVAVEVVCELDTDGDGCPDSKDPTSFAPPNGYCGDGITQANRGETCDDGEATELCDADCTLAECGDKVVNPHAGEWCEQFTQEAICNSDCTLSVCGDWIPNSWANETCDPGGTASCDGDCTAVTCGDGFVNPAAGEQCEAGMGDCLTSCQQAVPVASTTSNLETRTVRTEPFGDQISLEWTVLKTGGDLPLDELEYRYWFEPEVAPGSLIAVCDWAEIDCANVGVSLHDNPNGCSGATHYLSVTHTGGQTLGAGGIDYSLHVQATGSLDFTNDYSRSPNVGTKNIDPGIGVYRNGSLIQGTPPCGCGNGVLESGEQCDHGAGSVFCNPDCTWSSCRDTVVNPAAGEQCDPGATASLDCDLECQQTGMLASADSALRVWLDATDQFAFFRGDRIWSWIDEKTAFEYRQDTGSRQPAWVPDGINGLPAVWFDGIDDLLVGEVPLQTPDPIVDSPTGTVFIVHAVEPVGDTAQLLGNGYASSGGGWAVRARPQGDGLGIALASSTGWEFEQWHPDALGLGPPTPGFTRLYWDPQLLGVARGLADVADIRSVTYGSASEPLTLGGTDSGEPYRGYIGEILVFDRILTVEELASVADYLAAKWGVE